MTRRLTRGALPWSRYAARSSPPAERVREVRPAGLVVHLPTPAQVIDRFGELADAGAQHILFTVKDVWQTDKLELLGSTLLTQLRDA